MRIGIVGPYSWDIPGGVQAHVRDLAEKLLELGHAVSVLAPGDEGPPGLPPYVDIAGQAPPIPYHASPPRVPLGYTGRVAGLESGVGSAARGRRGRRGGAFAGVRVREPAPPSLSLLACM